MGFKYNFIHTKVGKCKIILHKIIICFYCINSNVYFSGLQVYSNSNDRAFQVDICYVM